MTRITHQTLESYLWGAAVLLRRTIEARDYRRYIRPLLFYKRLCDVFDEETGTALRGAGGDLDFALFPENHRFQVPADAHWREIRKVSRDVGRGLQQAMRAIETANPNLFGNFGDAHWTDCDRLSDAMLRDLIEHFSTLELTVANLPEEELRQGYRYLFNMRTKFPIPEQYLAGIKCLAIDAEQLLRSPRLSLEEVNALTGLAHGLHRLPMQTRGVDSSLGIRSSDGKYQFAVSLSLNAVSFFVWHLEPAFPEGESSITDFDFEIAVGSEPLAVEISAFNDWIAAFSRAVSHFASHSGILASSGSMTIRAAHIEVSGQNEQIDWAVPEETSEEEDEVTDE